MRSRDRRRWSSCAVPFGLTLGLLAFASAGAERATFSLSEVRVIANEGGVGRVLIQPTDLSMLSGELVTSAFLRLPLSGVEAAADLDIVIHALDRGWSGMGAGWASPWARPGGDLDSRYSHTVRVGRGRARTEIAIDVTLMVQEMADGLSEENGFLLTVPRSRGDGFTASERTVLGTLEGGTLEVTFRRISELGFLNGSLDAIPE
jgi:hypothetical protein